MSLPNAIPEYLIIFARYPTPGQVKTRLIPRLGAVGAAHLYRQMAEQTLHHALSLAAQRPLGIGVWYTGGEAAALAAWLGPQVAYHRQHGGDLGQRLQAAFAGAFAQGHRAVVAIGTDCPDLNTALLAEAFDQLQHHSLVLGPARDGGYYLIGLREPQPRLFEGIPWSSATVLATTVERADQLGLMPAYLATLSDVDRPEDLDQWPDRWQG
jgi:rSAM/selenodomain-associated transferase 1